MKQYTLFDLIKDPTYTHKYVLERICMHVLGYTREDIIIHYDDILDDTELLSKVKELYDQYAVNKQPLEYILGYVEYGGLRFHVNKYTIIPRPETEYMIEAVREYLTELKIKSGELRVNLVDVGTGSGVLGLSILHSHGSQIQSAFLIDISEDALAVAKKNYEFLTEYGQIDGEIEVVIEKGDLLSSPSLDRRLQVESDKLQENDVFNKDSETSSEGQHAGSLKPESWNQYIIVANLPYIPDETFDTNPDQSIKFEPRVAFVGGDDGLDLYRIMFEQIKPQATSYKPQVEHEGNNSHLNKAGDLKSITMFLEMMTWQVDILRKEFQWLQFEEIKTFHFQIRIVRVVYKVEGL